MTPLPDVKEEAKRLLAASSGKKLALRLIGGVGVSMRSTSAAIPGLKRTYQDLDFVAHEKQSKTIDEFFAEMGYQPRARFNAMNGRKRLIFNDLSNQRRVDVFLDVFEMSHKFDFSDRLTLEQETLPLADLLATKLQIFEITEKDFQDITALLLDHDVGASDGETINGGYLAKLASSDWGIYKTFVNNLAKLQTQVNSFGLTPAELERVRGRAVKLREMIEKQPKSVGWRLRAKVGEKVHWYEVPEPDKSVVVGALD